MFDFRRLESWNTAMELTVLSYKIAEAHEARRPASADTLRRASVQVATKIARASAGTPRQRERDLDRSIRAARALRAVLERLKRDETGDARVGAALELVERVIEVIPRADRVPRRKRTRGC